MGEQGPRGNQDPIDEIDERELVRHAQRTARELDRLVPPQDAHDMVRNPRGRTADELTAAFMALQKEQAARDAALPAAHTLAEAGEIVDKYANKPEGDE